MQGSKDKDGVLGMDLNTHKNGQYMLRLFITGATPNSVKAISNIKRICEAHLDGKYFLEIIDLYNKREIAEKEQVVAVPMLVKVLPLPVQRLIGDLSDNTKVLETLGLNL